MRGERRGPAPRDQRDRDRGNGGSSRHWHGRRVSAGPRRVRVGRLGVRRLGFRRLSRHLGRRRRRGRRRAGKAVAARIASGPVDRLLYLGDVYDEGTAEEFADEYHTTYGRLAHVTAPTSGNHDSGNESTGYDPYWRGVHGVSPPDWYAFRAGGWTILAMDSQAAHGRGSAQQRWLQRRLRSPGTCRVAFWHRPRFSAGVRHGDQEDVAPLVEALRGRAAIVVAGHEHNMQRFEPIDGVTHFVSGAGGHGRYPLHDDPRLAFGDDRHFGALRLRLRPGIATHAFITADGETLDSGVIRCARSHSAHDSGRNEGPVRQGPRSD